MYKPPPAVGPEIHQIRLIHRKPEATPNVDVIWWGRSKPEHPVPGVTYIDGPKPDFDARHAVLGKFIDTWSKLEGQMRAKIEQRLGSGTLEAKTVAYTQSGKAMVDLLLALSEPHLIPSKYREYVKLSERFGKANTTRNRLIHGHWSLEYIVTKKDDGPVADAQIVREYPPLSPSGSAGLQRFGSVERQKYLWQLDDIEEKRRSVETLMEDYRLFHNANLPWPPKARG